MLRTWFEEGGAILVTTTLSLVALIAMAALAIDLGSALVERRSARNAADHAALAAAWADCNGRDPQSAADSSVVRNGHNASALTLTDTPLGWNAQIDTTVGLTFAKVLGIGTVDVSGSATADCVASATGVGTALFASGNCGTDPTIELSGSSSEVYGGMHSNGNLKVNGSDNDFDKVLQTDPVTYLTNLDLSGTNNEFEDPYPEDLGDYPGDARGVPVTFNMSDYFGHSNFYNRSGGKITKDEVDSGPGIYYTDHPDGVDFGPDSFSEWDVTFLAPNGPIILNGAQGVVMRPFVDGLLAFTEVDYGSIVDKCSKGSIIMNGSDTAWFGIVYGTGGKIIYSGSGNESVSGSLIGFSVVLNGSDLLIEYDPDLFPASAGKPQLLE